ncbi:MAG: hypothetical protein F6K55_48120 [Moorea sp. SIO4A3]|nr:hypothetical protein [Moorena sp. SIO4A3]
MALCLVRQTYLLFPDTSNHHSSNFSTPVEKASVLSQTRSQTQRLIND